MRNIITNIKKQQIIKIVQSKIEDKEIKSEQYDENLQKLGMDSLKFI